MTKFLNIAIYFFSFMYGQGKFSGQINPLRPSDAYMRQ